MMYGRGHIAGIDSSPTVGWPGHLRVNSFIPCRGRSTRMLPGHAILEPPYGQAPWGLSSTKYPVAARVLGAGWQLAGRHLKGHLV